MDLNSKILSDVIVHMKYAKYLPEKKRRETWKELVDRNKAMHIKKFPELKAEINTAYTFVYDKNVLPSMRSLQFGGKPIEINPSRINNCAYLPIDSWEAFHEIIFLLLGGTGVGYSVQRHHIENLPELKGPNKKRTRRFLVGDSIEGWSEAIKVLFKAYFFGLSKPKFDYSDIRPKGQRLVTSGGKAPGPQPLKECITKLKGTLEEATIRGSLTTLECHDMVCHIADAVLAGGIRRAACISFFSINDNLMLSAKAGNWWENNPQRGRANNSAVFVRSRVRKQDFEDVFNYAKESGCGEPGVYFTNDKDFLSNPCCFSGDMKILTNKGYKTFKELSNKKEVKLVNSCGIITTGTVWKSGNNKTITLNLSNREKIKSTDDHVFLTNKGEQKAKNTKGKRLLIGSNRRKSFDDLYMKLGFIQGDGCLSRLSGKYGHIGFEINIGKKDQDIAFLFGYNMQKSRVVYTTEFFSLCKDLKFSDKKLPTRVLPKTYNSWTIKNKRSFLKGLWSANGSVIKNHRIAFKSTCFELVSQLLNTLKQDFNIEAYITTNKPARIKFSNGVYTTKESYDLNITQRDSVILFNENIGFIHKYKTKSLRDLLDKKSPKVLSIKKNNVKEAVYDFSIDSTDHYGIVGGVLAHNCEIGLKASTFCNLVEINVTTIESQEDLNNRARAASFIATLQASYTEYHYLRARWQKNTEKDALIGVSLTGIASNKLANLNCTEAAEIVKEENQKTAGIIGINPSARCTTIKPAGTSSIVLGSSSGIHGWHAKYFMRRIRVGKNEAIYKYLNKNHPELLEDDFFRPHDTAIITVPLRAPDNSITRDESSIELLERIKYFYKNWVVPGHNNGPNTNNISATVSVREHEWEDVMNWMWKNKEHFNGIAVLPYDGGTYKQPPFEECTKYMYDKITSTLTKVNLHNITEEVDDTDRQGEAACSGGSCEIT